MRALVLLIAAIANCKANYTLQPLTSNLFIEDITKVHLYHETWDLVVAINFTSNQQRISAINSTIELAESACNRRCAPQYEVQLVKSRYNRLVHKNMILEKLLGKNKRTKRGLANFIGDISKTLFGTLRVDSTNVN